MRILRFRPAVRDHPDARASHFPSKTVSTIVIRLKSATGELWLTSQSAMSIFWLVTTPSTSGEYNEPQLDFFLLCKSPGLKANSLWIIIYMDKRQRLLGFGYFCPDLASLNVFRLVTNQDPPSPKVSEWIPLFVQFWPGTNQDKGNAEKNLRFSFLPMMNQKRNKNNNERTIFVVFYLTPETREPMSHIRIHFSMWIIAIWCLLVYCVLCQKVTTSLCLLSSC